MKKKILEENFFFIADGNIAQLFFTQEISLPSKKSQSFLYFRFCLIQKFNEKGEKKYPTSCRHAKKCFPLHIVEWFDCAFVNLEARAYVRLVSEPLYFSAFMSAKDKTQYKLIARPK